MGKEFLGRGWKFPIKVDPSTGRIMTSEYEDDIKESIEIILNTSKGERIMRSEFGSNLKRFIFESTDATTMNLLKREIEYAIFNWEPRVKDVSVEIKKDVKDPTRLLIDINYVVRKTNNLFNLVYPFYINEGTKVE
ncbi:GPW/gp25 family protein [Wukongibacter baidiensis]|uniref:GPW/gp25 family protein n=1 Tax=Wukongibacter baidiensis TaxID=1723361 RepID=UPI003D7FD461